MSSTVNPARRRLLAAGASLSVAAIAARGPLAHAAERPIRMILPVSAGSGMDTIIRAAGPALNRAIGATLVVENIPGAGGLIGASTLVREPADGRTLGMVSNNHVIFPSVYKNVPFDAINDITPITIIGSTPFVLVANNGLAAKDGPELIALLRSQPESFNYASSGNGTILHLGIEMLLQDAGVRAIHIPYRGSGPMITDIIGGQVDFGMLALPAVAPHIQSGALKALGLYGEQRSPLMPELPTLAEQGLGGAEMEGWYAFVGPAGLAPETAQRIYEATKKAFADPELARVMIAQGNRIDPRDPQTSRDYFQAEYQRYADVVAAAGIEPQ